MIVHFFGNVFGIGFGNVSEPEYNISPETVPGKQILHNPSQNQHIAKIYLSIFVLFQQQAFADVPRKAQISEKMAGPYRTTQPP
jgi:hypothetical protein